MMLFQRAIIYLFRFPWYLLHYLIIIYINDVKRIYTLLREIYYAGSINVIVFSLIAFSAYVLIFFFCFRGRHWLYWLVGSDIWPSHISLHQSLIDMMVDMASYFLSHILAKVTFRYMFYANIMAYRRGAASPLFESPILISRYGRR